MLINTVEGQECRIAIVVDGVLEELYVERTSSASHVGNIYKGRITNVEPSIQAAFVDFGLGKNGFLHISDLTPQFFPRSYRGGDGGGEAVGRKRAHRDRPPIQECLRRGQEVVVQLTKEGIGTKGPTLTTYLSIPGRLLVMMPGMTRLGVSRKIEDDDTRSKARQILNELSPPPDMGFIVRTAAIGHSKRDFQRDLNYLVRLWKSVKKRINSSKAPAEIYQESDLVTRTLRDVYNADIHRIVCDREDVARKVKDFLDVALPRTKHRVELYTGKGGMFHDCGLEREIERIYSRRVELSSGGSLVIDQAEALVAIDVNSGRFREHSDAETNALKVNVEAAKEIARQLRLRDMGGVVVIDFIDMRQEKNRRTVERTLRDHVRNDRAKTKILKISAFGIVEMTRQRVRPSLKLSIFRTCWHCGGSGLVKSEESQALLVMRNLQRIVANDDIVQIQVAATPAVQQHLSNYGRREIADMELASGKRILLKADPALGGDEVRITCTNSRGNEVAWEQPPAVGTPKGKMETVPVADSVVRPSETDEEEGEDLAVFESVQETEETPDEEAAIAAAEARAEEVADAGELPQAAEVEAAAQPSAPPAQPPAPQRPQRPGTPSAGQQQPAQGQPAEGKRRRRRRGGRGRRRREQQQAQAQQPAEDGAAPAATPAPQAVEKAATVEPPQQQPSAPAQPPPAAPAPRHVQAIEAPGGISVEIEPGPEQPVKSLPKPRRRGRRGGRKHRKQSAAAPAEGAVEPTPPPQADAVVDDEDDFED
jgi:ribonuclease E